MNDSLIIFSRFVGWEFKNSRIVPFLKKEPELDREMRYAGKAFLMSDIYQLMVGVAIETREGVCIAFLSS